MIRKTQRLNPFRETEGFSLTEILVTTAIIGSISAIAYPNYVNTKYRTQQSDTRATMMSIPPIISAYVDATGEAPTTWDDLSSIAVVMTNNGPATGDLTGEKSIAITLPSSKYNLKVKRPTESVYTLTATRLVDEADKDDEYKFAIKSCFNISNGASDLRTGNLTEIADTLNCG